MKVKINQPFTLEELKPKLEAAFPEYKVKYRGKSILVVYKNATTAALVLGGKKDKAMVNESFATMGGQMVFVLCLVLLGILIPLIIYFAAFFPAQKEIRNKVADFIRTEYGDGKISGNSKILDQN